MKTADLTNQNLSALLSLFNVQTSLWGCDGTKTIGDLLKEVNGGTSSLVVGPKGLTRVMRIVVLLVRTPRGVFVEKSRLVNGRRIYWRQLPGGSMLPNESPSEAVIRKAREELGLVHPLEFKFRFIKTSVEMSLSRSYPGLLSSFERFLHGLYLRQDAHLPCHRFEGSAKIVYDWLRE